MKCNRLVSTKRPMESPTQNFYDALMKDIQKVNQIAIVPTILEVICKTTGMGFAAVARVTKEKWIACSVRDEIQFGLAPGGELEIQTTICNEIRDSGKLVVIDHVSEDNHFLQSPHTKNVWISKLYISSNHLENRRIFWHALFHRSSTCLAEQFQNDRYVHSVCRSYFLPLAKFGPYGSKSQGAA